MGGSVLISKDLETDPRFLRLSVAFRHALASRGVTLSVTASVTTLMGCLTRLWQYADTHIRPDNTLPMTADEIDEYLGFQITALMPDDWLVPLDDGRVELPDYLDRNGVESRKRYMANQRQKRHRLKRSEAENHADVTHESRNGVNTASPLPVPFPSHSRPEPSREREAPTHSPESVTETAPTPTEAQTVPALPDDVPGLDLPSVKKFLTHRAQLPDARPLTAMGLRSLCEKLAEHPVAVQRAMVARSVEGGWPGLYPLPPDLLAQALAVNGSNGAALDADDDWPTTVWDGLIESDGAWPERTPEIQAALDAAGGWLAIRTRTDRTEPRLRAAFVAALRSPPGAADGQR